ncbi:ChaN family lipoprotein [Variovorax terrae]|uniref:ChaN family lipoprotein n=1 Tax=Variovorax terrae TaxID=2923278 RepID=A0A9X2ANR0_9BURK|nr:ChaN family lipoprotein [Variovorax terrae]MCJ0764659.1 ChaN family lipoprotein [Variovorax terrae]
MALLLPAMLLAACAGPGPAGPALATRLDALLPADALLLGEQHDAEDHHRLERDSTALLAERGVLAALVLEMADQGGSTAGLPRDAGEARVRDALHWDERAWPWRSYGPAVMAAVRAGVPVLGANLPRSRLREAMADAALDQQLPGPALKAQQQAIRAGHCGLLPESQITPMTRIQIARDRSMAQTLQQAAVPGRTVLLIAGAGHVDRSLGVARHLPPDFKAKAVKVQAGGSLDAMKNGADFDSVWATPPVPPLDHCAELERALPARTGAASAQP